MQASKKLALIWAMAMTAVSANAAVLDGSAQPTEGKIDFAGEIVGTTCSVSVPDQTVDLGTWNKDYVNAQGQTGTTPVEFRVALNKCQKKDVASIEVKAEKALATVVKGSGYDIKNTASGNPAANVGIGVYFDRDFIDFTSGSYSIYTRVDSPASFEPYTFKANIRQTSTGPADVGPVKGTMTVVVNYK